MPSRLEQFAQQVRLAAINVTDLTRLLGSATTVLAQMDKELFATNGNLVRSNTAIANIAAKRTALQTQITAAQDPNSRVPRTDVMAMERRLASLQAREQILTTSLTARQASFNALQTERAGIAQISPTQDIITRLKAIQTLTAEYNRLGQSITRMQNLGPAGAAGIQSLNNRRMVVRDVMDLNWKSGPMDYFNLQQNTLGGSAAAQRYVQNQTSLARANQMRQVLSTEQVRINNASTASGFYSFDDIRKLESIARALLRIQEIEQRLIQTQSQLGIPPILNQTTPHPQAGANANLPPYAQAWNGMTPAQQSRQLALDRDAADVERTQRTYQTTDRYTSARKIAEERGFTPGTLRSIKGSGIEGIEKLTYAYKDMQGINRELALFTDINGRVLPTASRQFSNFASSVGRDFRELMKWTIAIQLIYGPIRKLQEIMTLMIGNEVRLADASIAVSDSTLKMGQIFDIANDAANAMGENVSEVITNFSEAYQATGGMGTAMERTAAATQLMNDALILSKLSSLNATQSIDVLASALRQSGMELTEGGTLLDKWVRVTKVANVSLDTLATGFSVLGEAASAAGLNDEQLNAVLAVTSETMGVTGREAANMARSFVAGFQSDKAVAALNSVGIATKTTSGEMRTLLDLQRDLYNAKQAGTISPGVYSKLTLAIGGGTRRQAAVAGFIESFPRISQIVDAQSNVSGQASAALAKQLDTVQTSMTRLQNAFQSLAQSLGDEGGLLDIFKVVLDLFSAVTTMADKMFESVGKAGPVLALALGAGIMIKSQGPLWTKNFAGSVGVGVANLTGGVGPNGEPNRYGTFAQNVLLGGRPTQPGTPATAISAEKITGIVGSAILMGVLPALTNFGNYGAGKDKFGAAKGTADIIGAGIGAVLIPQAPMIGAAIGMAISEAFVTAATKDLTALLVSGGKEVASGRGTSQYDTTVQERLGGGNAKQWLASIVAWIDATAIKAVVPNIPEGYGAKLPTTESVLYQWLGKNIFGGGEKAGGKEAQAEFDAWYNSQIASGAITPETTFRPFEDATKKEQTDHGAYIDTQRKLREQELLDDLIKGKTTPTAYTGKMEGLGTFKEVSTRFFAAFGDEWIKISDDINTAEDAYSAFMDIFMYGGEEQIASLTAMVTDVAELTAKVEALKEAGASRETTAPLEAEIARLQEILAQSANAMANQTFFEKNPVPQMFNQGRAITGDKAMLKEWLLRSGAAEAGFLGSKGGGNQTREQIEAYRTLTNEDISIPIEEGGQIVYKKLTQLAEDLGIPQELIGGDWLQKIFDEMIAEGKLDIKIEVVQKGLTDIGLPRSQEGLLTQWVNYFTAMFKNWGVTDETRPQVIIWEDGQWSEMKAGDKAFAMAQEKMNETLTKQLEQGMWNIPEGATWMLPLQSAYYNGPPQGSGTPLGPPAVTPGPGGGPISLDKTRWPVPDKNWYTYPAGIAGSTGSGLIEPPNPDRNNSKQAKISEGLIGLGGGGLSEGKYGIGIGAPGSPGTSPATIFESLMRLINMWQMNSTSPSKVGKGVFGTEVMPTAPKVSLNLTNTTTLTLDGRILALSMKKYMVEDMNNAKSTLGATGSVI